MLTLTFLFEMLMSELFWTVVALLLVPVFTAGLYFVAKQQLIDLNKTTSAELLIKFKNDFFTSENRKIFRLICDERLMFDSGIFRNNDYVDGKIDPYEIDDFLGHYEDLGVLVRQGLIKLPMAYELFGYYIITSWENNDIKKYIKQQREEEKNGDDIYDNFEFIYKKCVSYENIKIRVTHK